MIFQYKDNSGTIKNIAYLFWTKIRIGKWLCDSLMKKGISLSYINSWTCP